MNFNEAIMSAFKSPEDMLYFMEENLKKVSDVLNHVLSADCENCFNSIQEDLEIIKNVKEVYKKEAEINPPIVLDLLRLLKIEGEITNNKRVIEYAKKKHFQL